MLSVDLLNRQKHGLFGSDGASYELDIMWQPSSEHVMCWGGGGGGGVLKYDHD